MATVVVKNKDFAVLNLSSKGTSLLVKKIRILPDASQVKLLKGAAWAVPLSELTFEYVSIPVPKDADVKKIVELQNSFYFPKWGSDAVAALSYSWAANNINYRIFGYEAPKNTKPVYALTKGLAVVQLAFHLNKINADKSVLVVCAEDCQLSTVMIDKNNVGLMREIMNPMDINCELRLSMQVKSNGIEEGFKPADEILWFGDSSLLTENLMKEFNIEVVDTSNLLSELPEGISQTDMLAAAGMLFNNKKNHCLGPWKMTEKKDSPSTVLKRMSVWLLPLLFVLFGLYTWFEVWLMQDKIRHYKNEFSRIQNHYQAVRTIKENYIGVMSFLSNKEKPLKSAEKWQNIFDKLSKNRPYGVKLKSLSGGLSSDLTINGEAEGFHQIAQYLQSLRSTDLFKKTILKSSTEHNDKDRNVVEFSMEVDWSVPKDE